MEEKLHTQEVEEWKKTMLELPDELFFSIMRTYLGELKTPFHKPTLVDRLTSFLAHEETIRRIAALIDERDSIFLTAVHVLERPHISDLFTLFEEELDYFTFHARLRNLQERLLLYHRRYDDSISINPILERSLRRHAIKTDLLFEYRHIGKAAEGGASSGSKKAAGSKVDSGSGKDGEEDREEKKPCIREILLWAFVCFLFTDDHILKADGNLKKKSMDTLSHLFSGEGGGEERFRLVMKTALRLGLVEQRENRLIPQKSTLDRYARLPKEKRVSSAWAAAGFELKNREKDTSAPSPHPKEIYRRARILHLVLTSMPPQTVFTYSGLRRLIRVYSILDRAHHRFMPVRPVELVELQLLEEVDEGVMISRRSLEEFIEHPAESPLLIQPDFTVTIKPPFDFATGIRIGEVFDIVSYDVYPRFELTKYSYTRARSRRFSYEELVSFLEANSENELPHNIRMTIGAWERSFSGIRLFEGIVLQVDEERSHLVEHTPALQEHILHSFGKGMYLLDPGSVDRWSRALERSGIEPIPPIRKPGRERKHGEASEEKADLIAMYGEDASSDDASIITDKSETEDEREHEGKSAGNEEALKQELYGAVEPLRLNETQKREIEQFIDHKLVLFPEQVGRRLMSDETNEARGIDYTGKVRIVDQSVSNEFDLLEIVIRMPAGKPKRMLLRPERLERGEKELYLIGSELPHGDIQRIAVGKISYIKRWKSSLFTRPEDSLHD